MIIMCILLHFIHLLSRRINQLFRSTGQMFVPVEANNAGMHFVLFNTFFSPDKERKDMQDGGLNYYRI